MAALAKADWPRLEALWSSENLKPDYAFLRAPESGLVMLRGRMGGTGAPFNFGEATVTRCSVQLADGMVGHAYVMGRNHAHAEIAAVCDALMQRPQSHDAIQQHIIAPLLRSHDEQRCAASSKAAATKVDFFTMVRGED